MVDEYTYLSRRIADIELNMATLLTECEQKHKLFRNLQSHCRLLKPSLQISKPLIACVALLDPHFYTLEQLAIMASTKFYKGSNVSKMFKRNTSINQLNLQLPKSKREAGPVVFDFNDKNEHMRILWMNVRDVITKRGFVDRLRGVKVEEVSQRVVGIVQ